MYSRPQPSATNIAPSRKPRPPPPPASTVRTMIATPIPIIVSDRIRVAVRWAWRGVGMTAAESLGRPAGLGDGEFRRLGGLGGRGLDDHAARPLGEHRFQRLVEQRAARSPPRQRHHDRARAHLAGLLHDPAPRLPGADLLPVPGHAAAALHLGLLDRGLRRSLLLGK